MSSVRHKDTFDTFPSKPLMEDLPTVNIFTQRQVEISILVTNLIARWASSWRLAGALRNVFLAKSMLELSYFAHAIVLELKFVQICNDIKNNNTMRNIFLAITTVLKLFWTERKLYIQGNSNFTCLFMVLMGSQVINRSQ